MNIAEHLVKRSSSSPDTCALKMPRRNLFGKLRYNERSFTQLNADTDALAHTLASEGICKGMRVLVLVRPGLELIYLNFAIFKLGAIPVVIDPGMGRKAFLKCVRRTQPEALLGIPKAILLSKLFPQSFESLRIRLSVSPRNVVRWISQSKEKGPFPLAKSDPKETAAILFTSGSTGTPKGVVYRHAMLEAQVSTIGSAYNMQAGEVDLPMLPVFALFNPAFGITSVIPEMDPRHPAKAPTKRLIEAIQTNKVTTSFGSPVLWAKIADSCEATNTKLPSLKRILMAGTAVPVDLIRRFQQIAPSATVHTPYGATEGLPVSSISGPELLVRTNSDNLTCIGKALPGIQLRVIKPLEKATVTAEDLEPCSDQQIGELIVSGPVVSERYDRLLLENAQSKIQDGKRVWHRMGDMAYREPDGTFVFCGRKAERICTEKKTYYTAICEAPLNKHPKIYRSALIGLQNGDKTTPAIAIEPYPQHYAGNFLKRHTLRRQLIAEFAHCAAMHPELDGISHFFICKSMPVDVRHNAKIHRLALGRRYSRNLKLSWLKQFW